MNDPYDLARFVDAQDRADAFEHALSELRCGQKRSHWMWFVFPQIAGLGQSAMSRRFAIRSLAEAREYLDHDVLGPRLRECVRALLDHEGRSAEQMVGGVDACKLRSSMTLFQRADPDDHRFGAVLDRYFDGRADPRTDERL